MIQEPGDGARRLSSGLSSAFLAGAPAMTLLARDHVAPDGRGLERPVVPDGDGHRAGGVVREMRGASSMLRGGGAVRVLLVEDDAMIGNALVAALRREGTAIDWLRSGKDALDALATRDHAVVLLDLGLPDLSGLDVLKALRARRCTASILVITARDALDDRVQALDLGADDYLVKPFEAAELLARMRAVTRRAGGALRSRLSAGVLTLDLATHEMSWRGSSCLLPAREFALMSALMERPGAILSRAQLEERLYDWSTEIESNAIDALVHSVRKRFEKDVIRNVRGAGWMVAAGPS